MTGVDAPGVIRLSGRVVIDDTREVGEVWVVGRRITFSKPRHSGDETAIHGVILPGLVDVHCHVGVEIGGAVVPELAHKQAAADRDTGVLLIRDAGSASDTSWLDSRDDCPRIVRAGRFLARPKRYIRGLARELSTVDELPTAAADEARFSAAAARHAIDGGLPTGWIKIIADWIDRDLGGEGDLCPLWPDDVLASAMVAAHAEGARVTAHTFATESVDGLLLAGIDCIEHGTGMTDAQIERAAALGIPVVPTLLQIGQFASIADAGEAKFPLFATRMRGMYTRRHAQVRAFHEAGVQMFVGTDAGGSIGHGSLPEEAEEMVAAGVPPHEVIAAASWRGRAFLGAPGIEEGASADLVVYPEDPREDIRVIAHPKGIILRGQTFAKAEQG
jgi:imidazolonepropionase-like amidohydrolase